MPQRNGWERIRRNKPSTGIFAPQWKQEQLAAEQEAREERENERRVEQQRRLDALRRREEEARKGNVQPQAQQTGQMQPKPRLATQLEIWRGESRFECIDGEFVRILINGSDRLNSETY